MVVVKIGDGLGNQMFNYVCGYSVAKHDGDELLLDTSEVDNSTFRSYGLDRFNIEYTKRESFSNRTVFHKIYKRLRRNLKYQVIKERKDEAFPLDMRVYRKKRLRNKYLHGYFQNIYYYDTCREEIRRQFSPREPLPEQTVRLMEELAGENTCSLHIRGGDIKPLPVEYYKEAVARLKREYPGIRFVVFSNVRELAQQYIRELGEPESCFIWELGSFSDFDELFLMKSCRCHILSDSTFSRWAALLDEGQGMVAAPASPDQEKIYPPEWIVLP